MPNLASLGCFHQINSSTRGWRVVEMIDYS
jgi:hypothetical protein